MKKSIIERLKKKVKNRNWTDEEKANLKELKENGIYPSIIINDKETMNEFFPGRTKESIIGMYQRV
jgi:hypothetical protein